MVNAIIDSEKISSLGIVSSRGPAKSVEKFRSEKTALTIRKSKRISKKDHKGRTFIVTIWTAILRHEKVPQRDSRVLHHRVAVMHQPQCLTMTKLSGSVKA